MNIKDPVFSSLLLPMFPEYISEKGFISYFSTDKGEYAFGYYPVEANVRVGLATPTLGKYVAQDAFKVLLDDHAYLRKSPHADETESWLTMVNAMKLYNKALIGCSRHLGLLREEGALVRPGDDWGKDLPQDTRTYQVGLGQSFLRTQDDHFVWYNTPYGPDSIQMDAKLTTTYLISHLVKQSDRMLAFAKMTGIVLD